MSLIPAPFAGAAVAPAAPCPHRARTRWELSCAAVPPRLCESRMYNDFILPTSPFVGHCISLPHHTAEFHKAYSPQLPWRLLPLSETWLKCPSKVTAGRDKSTGRQAGKPISVSKKKKSHTRTGTVCVEHVQTPACRTLKAVWRGSAVGFPAHCSGAWWGSSPSSNHPLLLTLPDGGTGVAAAKHPAARKEIAFWFPPNRQLTSGSI